MTQTALILGASGRFGRAASLAFDAAGWHVVRFDRETDDLTTAAASADVIVNGWNPKYPDWVRQIPDLHARVISAAKAAGATVILPGNVYVFAPQGPTGQVPEIWGPETPHDARNPLGRIRVEMEQAYRQSGVQTILLRAGDFIDTAASGNWFDMIMIKKLAQGRFTYPGEVAAPHAWAYLPDLARAAVQLAERREELPTFCDIPYPGYTVTGEELVAALGRIMARPVHLKRMNWLPLWLLSPVWPLARCLLEMRYLWNTPHRLEEQVFSQALPDFVPTSLEDALATAIPVGLLAPPRNAPIGRQPAIQI